MTTESTFLEWLRGKSKGVDFAQSFYLEVHRKHRNNDDDGESYCWECVNKQRWLNRHKRDPYTNIHREDWPDKDSSSFCGRCYTPLEHSPSNYHIKSEIEHYANHANEPTSPTDALLLLNMMEMGAWESDKHWPGLAPVAAAMMNSAVVRNAGMEIMDGLAWLQAGLILIDGSDAPEWMHEINGSDVESSAKIIRSHTTERTTQP